MDNSKLRHCLLTTVSFPHRRTSQLRRPGTPRWIGSGCGGRYWGQKTGLYDFWSERFTELSRPERGWTRNTRAEAIMLPGEGTDEALETALELLEDQDGYQQLQSPTLNPRSPR